MTKKKPKKPTEEKTAVNPSAVKGEGPKQNEKTAVNPTAVKGEGPKQGAKKPPEGKSTLSKAKDAVEKVVEKVSEVVAEVADAAKEHVVTPVAEAVGIVKKKKARYVREKKKKEPEAEAKPSPSAPRPRTAAARIMSKNVPIVPKEEPAHGPHAKKGKP